MSTTAELVKTLVSPAIASHLRRKLALRSGPDDGDAPNDGDRMSSGAVRQAPPGFVYTPPTAEQLAAAQADRELAEAAAARAGGMSDADILVAQSVARRIGQPDFDFRTLPSDQQAIYRRYISFRTNDVRAGVVQGIYSLRGLGVPPTETTDESYDTAMTTVAVIGWGLTMGGAAAGAYHGYKRNNSIGWAIVWSFMGGILPVITIGVAAAQGFGKRAK